MAENIEVQIVVKRNGLVIEQITRRLSVDEAEQFQTEQASSVTYVAPPVAELDTIQFLLLKADQVTSLRFANQSDAGLAMNANGIVLLIDANINVAAATNLKVQNNSGSTAILKGTVGGT